MKKIVLIFSFMLINFSCFSQDKFDSKKCDISVIAGLNNSKTLIPYFNNDKWNYSKPGLTSRLSVSRYFKSIYFVQISGQFNQFSNKYIRPDLITKFDYNFLDLSFNVGLRYNFKRLSFYTSLGTGIKKCISVKSENNFVSLYTGTSTFTGFWLDPDVSDTKNTLNLLYNLGMDYNLSQYFSIRLNAGLDNSITDTRMVIHKNIEWSEYDFKFHSINYLAGLNFKF